jgi:hypothetical protein
MGFFDDILGKPRKKARRKNLIKAWALWARGTRYGEDAMLVDTFKTKHAARVRLKRLLKGADWRRADDYEIRQIKIASGRIFENR